MLFPASGGLAESRDYVNLFDAPQADPYTHQDSSHTILWILYDTISAASISYHIDPTSKPLCETYFTEYKPKSTNQVSRGSVLTRSFFPSDQRLQY